MLGRISESEIIDEAVNEVACSIVYELFYSSFYRSKLNYKNLKQFQIMSKLQAQVIIARIIATNAQ